MLSSMKKIVIVALLIICLVAPQVQAQTVTTDRAVLLAQIQELLSLVGLLQQQLDTMRGVVPTYTTPTTLPVADRVTLEDFPRAIDPWSANIKTTSVPKNAYKAHYFNTEQPNIILKSEIVPKVAVAYAWGDGNDFEIDSEEFGGWWVGDITIPTNGMYVVSTAESWSESRVMIDGRVIKTEATEEVRVFLTAGVYRVEVEYVNNWHTTDFAMNILPETPTFSLPEIRSEISEYSGAENWYIGVYESGNFNKTISTDVTAMSDSAILFLASYAQVDWNVKANSSLEAVVYASYEAGTTLSGVPNGVPVFKVDYETLATEYSLEEGCDSYQGVSFSACEYIDQLTKVDSSIRTLTGSLTSTFSGGYSEQSIVAPEITLSAKKRVEILDSYAAAKAEAMTDTESQSIENIF